MKTWTGYKNYLRDTGKDPLFDLEERCAKNLVCNYDYFRIVYYPWNKVKKEFKFYIDCIVEFSIENNFEFFRSNLY